LQNYLLSLGTGAASSVIGTVTIWRSRRYQNQHKNPFSSKLILFCEHSMSHVARAEYQNKLEINSSDVVKCMRDELASFVIEDMKGNILNYRKNFVLKNSKLLLVTVKLVTISALNRRVKIR
jgi:hypothetical protein